MPGGSRENMDALWKISEVARQLRVSPATVYSWVRSGKMPAVRIGPRLIRIRDRDLEAFAVCSPEQDQAYEPTKAIYPP